MEALRASSGPCLRRAAVAATVPQRACQIKGTKTSGSIPGVNPAYVEAAFSRAGRGAVLEIYYLAGARPAAFCFAAPGQQPRRKNAKVICPSTRSLGAASQWLSASRREFALPAQQRLPLRFPHRGLGAATAAAQLGERELRAERVPPARSQEACVEAAFSRAGRVGALGIDCLASPGWLGGPCCSLFASRPGEAAATLLRAECEERRHPARGPQQSSTVELDFSGLAGALQEFRRLALPSQPRSPLQFPVAALREQPR